MDNTQQYIDVVWRRLLENGFEVSGADIGGLPAMVGYKSEFRWCWMASKMHLFICVAPISYVTPEWLEHFTRASLELADRAKGSFRGFQSGIVTIPVLVGQGVDPRAAAYAQREIVRKFAGFAWPATFDSTTQTLTSHVGNPFVGWIFNKWMHSQIATCLVPSD